MKHTSQRTIRLYHPEASAPGPLGLNQDQAHYLRNVLRMTPGHSLQVFNGNGLQWQARVDTLSRKSGQITLLKPIAALPASCLDLTLVQAISKGDRMDFCIQKSVELGVNRICPVFSQRGDVKLRGERLEKKLRHWRQVAISACEQCGRSDLPCVEEPAPLSAYLEKNSHPGIFLDPRADDTLTSAAPLSRQTLDILVGPEGGFSMEEVAALKNNGCIGIRLGPRILRTETAGPAVIAALQALAGDFR